MKKIKKIVSSIIIATLPFGLFGCSTSSANLEKPDNTLIAIKKNAAKEGTNDIYMKYEKDSGFKKIIDKAVLDNQFSNLQYFTDSRALVYQDSEKNVFMFEEGKAKTEIAKSPSETIINNKKDIAYIDKNKNLYLKPYGKEKVQIASNVGMARLNPDSNQLVYTNDKAELFLTNNGDKTGKKIGTGIKALSFTECKDKILITKEDKAVYIKELKENGKEEKLGNVMNNLFIRMYKDGGVTYFKNIKEKDKKYFSDLYYKPSGKEEVKIASNVNASPYDFQVVNGVAYYMNNENKFFSTKLATKETKELGKDIVNFMVDEKGNTAYLNNKDNLTVKVEGKENKNMKANNQVYTLFNGKIYLLGKDKVLKIDDKVIAKNVEFIQIDKGDIAYYTTDNKLYLLKGENKSPTKVLDSIKEYDAIFYAGNPLYVKQ